MCGSVGMLQPFSAQRISRLRAGLDGFVKRVRLPTWQGFVRSLDRPALAQWQNLRLELIRDQQMPHQSPCFHRVGPMFWVAEVAAWRVELAWKHASPLPWIMALQPVDPEPIEPWTLARASSFDGLLNTSRELLVKQGGACEMLA